MNDSPDQRRRFLLILSGRHPAVDVEELRLACRTLQKVLPKQQKQFARTIGVSGYTVWQARNVATTLCAAFDALESRGLPLTKENFRLLRDDGRRALSDTTCKNNFPPDASLGAEIVPMLVKPWSARGSCRMPGRRKAKLPWRLRLHMAMPTWVHQARGRLGWMMSRLRNGSL